MKALLQVMAGSGPRCGLYKSWRISCPSVAAVLLPLVPALVAGGGGMEGSEGG